MPNCWRYILSSLYRAACFQLLIISIKVVPTIIFVVFLFLLSLLSMELRHLILCLLLDHNLTRFYTSYIIVITKRSLRIPSVFISSFYLDPRLTLGLLMPINM